MTNTKCRAKNPATCHYHGSVEHHMSLYRKANSEYVTILRKNLENPRNVAPNAVSEAKAKSDYTRSLVDSHDENFEQLTIKVAEIEAQAQVSYITMEQEMEYRDLAVRYRNAEKMRTKIKNSDEPEETWTWTSDYVRNLPANVELENGEKVLYVRRIPKIGTHRDVLIENAEGEVRLVRWNSNTKVTFKETDSPVEEDGKDPWAPA